MWFQFRPKKNLGPLAPRDTKQSTPYPVDAWAEAFHVARPEEDSVWFQTKPLLNSTATVATRVWSDPPFLGIFCWPIRWIPHGRRKPVPGEWEQRRADWPTLRAEAVRPRMWLGAMTTLRRFRAPLTRPRHRTP